MKRDVMSTKPVARMIDFIIVCILVLTAKLFCYKLDRKLIP
jgi:hypothetical protein